MTVRSITQSYENSSEAGRERMVTLPYARLTDVTPTLHDPAQVTSAVVATNFHGTVITLDATDSMVVLNCADGAQYNHNIRNVITYDGQDAETGWRVINVGDVVYYDATADANTAGVCKLSTSPLDGAGAANAIFGHVVLMRGETNAADFPKGAGGAGSNHVCAVAQV